MPARIICLLALIIWFALVCSDASVSRAQSSFAQFQELLREQAKLDATDLAALEQGDTVVKLLPVHDRREVAVYGLVGVQAPVEAFLEFYREGMTNRNNPAILEKGTFSNPPKLDDLRSLTIENRDLDDMRHCVVGRCELKLSAAMIERFHREVNWDAPDYRLQAAQLIKLMLLQYVQDYLARGNQALIDYNDKQKKVRLAEEHRSLIAASRYLNGAAPEFPLYLKSFPQTELPNVEHVIGWSKIKFGFKPVIAINHTMIYRRERETGPQVLIASKQIYANHYFNSSLGLTALINVPGEHPGSYLLYENRSRADGLEGAFSRIKRTIVENEAVDSLKDILQQSKVSLETHGLHPTAPLAATVQEEHRPTRWSFGGIHFFWWFFWITALVVLLGLTAYDWKDRIRGEETPR